MKRIFALMLAVALILMAPVSSFGAASLMPPPVPQFFDNSGHPCSGCKIYTYENGTSTPKTTWTDSSQGVPNANPVVLNSRGEPASGIWMNGVYSVTLKTAAGSVIWGPKDNITGLADAALSAQLSQWVSSGLVPTYISGTSFSTTGDNTAILEVGRRAQITVSAGIRYGTISLSTYGGGLTTTTVAMDSGALDTGITTVNVGLFPITDNSLPTFPSITKTDDYTITPADRGRIIIANKSSAVAFTIPAANLVANGTRYILANIGTGLLTITGTVDGFASPTIGQYAHYDIVSDGTTWHFTDGLNAVMPIVTKTDDYAISGTDGGKTIIANKATAINFTLPTTTITKTVTMTMASPAVFTSATHGFSIGDQVRFTTTGNLYTGILTTRSYYIITAGFTANDFEIATSPNGVAITTTGSQSGTHSVLKETPSVADGTAYSFKNIGAGTLTLIGTVGDIMNPTFTTTEAGEIFSNGNRWYKKSIANGWTAARDSTGFLSKENNKLFIEFADHFSAGLTGGLGQLGWTRTEGGVSPASQSGSILTLTTGITNTNYQTLNLGPSATEAKWVEDIVSNAAEINMVVTVGNATNSKVKLGFTGLLTDGDRGGSENGIYFQDDGTAANWQAVAIKAGTGTVLDTGIAITASPTYQRLKLVHRTVARDSYDDYQFYINDALVATIGTNLPIITTLTPVMLIETGSTGAKTLFIDYWGMKVFK